MRSPSVKNLFEQAERDYKLLVAGVEPQSVLPYRVPEARVPVSMTANRPSVDMLLEYAPSPRFTPAYATFEAAVLKGRTVSGVFRSQNFIQWKHRNKVEVSLGASAMVVGVENEDDEDVDIPAAPKILRRTCRYMARRRDLGLSLEMLSRGEKFPHSGIDIQAECSVERPTKETARKLSSVVNNLQACVIDDWPNFRATMNPHAQYSKD